jgi:hypothetical protein
MSYSFSASGATADEVRTQVRDQLSAVRSGQPSHVELDAVGDMVDDCVTFLRPLAAGEQYLVKVNGSVSWHTPPGDLALTSVSANIYVGIQPASPPAARHP